MKGFLGTCPKEGLRVSAYWGLSVMWRKGLHKGGQGGSCPLAGASRAGGKKRKQAISRLGLLWAPVAHLITCHFLQEPVPSFSSPRSLQAETISLSYKFIHF